MNAAFRQFLRHEGGNHVVRPGRGRCPGAALAVSGPVSRMTFQAVETIAAELRVRAAELESLI
jgi:DNA-binding IclR family transcriptional regulator